MHYINKVNLSMDFEMCDEEWKVVYLPYSYVFVRTHVSSVCNQNNSYVI